MEDNFIFAIPFRVTLCLGRGDGGDVEVSTNVTAEEYEDLKANEGEVYNGTPLYYRIIEDAKTENEYCLRSMGSDEKIDYDSISYLIECLDEDVYAEEDDDDDDDDEEEY